MMLVCAYGYDDNSGDDREVIGRSDVCDGTWQRLTPDNILSDQMAADLSTKGSFRSLPGCLQL
jgi:hypothetical protein